MAQTSQSATTVLPNGNRVTVKVAVASAMGGAGTGSRKTVTVKYKNGNSVTNTYFRGHFLRTILGAYDMSIPQWAKE